LVEIKNYPKIEVITEGRYAIPCFQGQYILLPDSLPVAVEKYIVLYTVKTALV
jgi:hypothetical protein